LRSGVVPSFDGTLTRADLDRVLARVAEREVQVKLAA
jgi:hypothetical protein